MEDSKNRRLFPFLDRLKRIKHLDIIITILFIAIILLIYFATNSATSTKDKSSGNVSSSKTEEESYEETLSSHLEDTISYINGVEKVRVLLTFDEGVREEIAYTIDTKTLSDGTKVETKSPVLITKDGKQSPIVLQKIMPKVKSAIIVASGNISTEVRLEILRLVEKSLNISTSNIEIFAGK